MVNCNIEGGNSEGHKQMEKHLNDSLQITDLTRWVFSQPSLMCLFCRACPVWDTGWRAMVARNTTSFVKLSNISLIFSQYKKQDPWEGETHCLEQIYHMGPVMFSSREQPVIKYQGVNGLADSRSFDLMHFRIHHGGSFSSQAPEVLSFVPQHT